ncbi:S8 family peptidase [Actinoalloteichus hymeniacidonis]|uniref:Subtilase family protease n=1 Tax=Actinoalloteichus hymeniacidonis TaxID=340345 RepID=A0AAC9MZN7_9PSEU|nr:S8 family serine peptidase [Actinoalloteichus hymeniacidonis]AOS64262.1 subtilase family protease [Actinoalloteichus hymeniacidonis]MBB5907670.1 subtilisin family serine protease [Actinoalloteichus hymeniacidonis]
MRLPVLRSTVALAAAAALAIPTAAWAADPVGSLASHSATSTASGQDGPIRSVTLITGDRVLFTENAGDVDVVSVTQPPQRRGIGWTRFWDDTGVSVLPSDALPLVAADRLDERLFHITSLVEQGLADDEQEDLRLLVTDGADDAGNVGIFDSPELPEVAEISHSLPDLGVQSLSVPRTDTPEFWAELTARPTTFTDSTDTLWLDGRVRSTLDTSVPLIGAPQAWESGFTGAGVRVAVLDTGYDTAHPDLADQVVESESFVADLPVQDGNGHGTHVASTIAGSGAASDGRYQGVAPDAELLIGKVLDDSGGGFESDIIAGMEWAAGSGADVVNMSLGGPAFGEGDPMVLALDDLSETHGTLFVTAAGNSGARESVGSPAVADSALAVGSTTKEDGLSEFSSQGPRPWDFGLKPEISAPGTGITAAAAGAGYVSMDGTSMAAPHVAGAAAIVAQAYPEADGDELKSLLLASAQPLADISVHAQGAGRVDVARAVDQRLRAEPAVLGFGRLAWPHDPAKPTTRTMTYHNSTEQPIELALTIDGPAKVVVLDSDTVEVPAQGSAEVEVQVGASNEAVGEYTGHLVAEAGEHRLVTPLSVHVAPEAHDVAIEATDSAGNPSEALFILQDRESGAARMIFASEEPQVRVDAGDYRVIAFGLRYADGEVEAEHTAFVLDSFTVEEGATLRLSGQDSERVEIDLDATDEVRQDLATVILESTLHPELAVGIQVDALPNNLVIPSGPVPNLEYHYSGFWGVPWASATVLGDDGFEVGWALEQSIEGHDLSAEGTLIDVTRTAPEDIGDMTGMIPLIADTDGSLDEVQLLALVESLERQGAELVLSFNYIEDMSILPVVQVYHPVDVQRLLSRIETRPTDIAVTLTPQSPTGFHLADSVFGGLDAETTDWRFDQEELAEVESVHNHPLGVAREWTPVLYNVEGGISLAVESPRRLPHRRTDYYSPDVEWSTYTSLGHDETTFEPYPDLQTSFVGLPAGPHPAHTFWVGPLGPSLPQSRFSPEGTVPPVFRRDDVLTVDVPMFGDSNAHNIAFPHQIDTGNTVLRQDDTEIGRSESAGSGSFQLPAGSDGWFELSATGTRSAEWWPISTEVQAEWRFQSGSTEEGTIAAPRLLDIRYDLDLDETNSASAGAAVTGSVTAAATEGESPLIELVLSYSLDDGVTWQEASAKQDGDIWTVEIPAADEGSFVSLRTTAEDESEHSVTEEIIRAYQVK